MIVAAGFLVAAAISAQVAAAQEQQIAFRAAGDVQAVHVTLSKTLTVRLNRDFSDLVVGNPDIADVMPLTNRSLYILGRSGGRTNIAVYDDSRSLIGVIDVDVSMDIEEVNRALRAAVPNGQVRATLVNGRIQLGGRVADGIGLRTALDIAQQFSNEPVINTVQVTDAQQVMLEVRFLEANRDAGRELGVGWANRDAGDLVFGAPGVQFEGLTIGGGELPSGNAPFSTLIANVLDAGLSIDIIVKALESKGLARSLAEPNLIAQSGETASFLAGGEFPYAVPGTANEPGGVAFKEYGVRLTFTPIVLDNGLINLEVTPEVSQIDPTLSVSINGTGAPALLTRRTHTTVELRDGQSFAIAGLLMATNTRAQRQVPWLGQVPVLGALFRSSSYQKHETDLVVLITVHLVRPAKPGEPLHSPLASSRGSDDAEFFLLGMLEVTDEDIHRFSTGAGAGGQFGHILNPPLLQYPPRGSDALTKK